MSAITEPGGESERVEVHLRSLDGWADHVGRAGQPASGDAIREHVAKLRAALRAPAAVEAQPEVVEREPLATALMLLLNGVREIGPSEPPERSIPTHMLVADIKQARRALAKYADDPVLYRRPPQEQSKPRTEETQ